MIDKKIARSNQKTKELADVLESVFLFILGLVFLYYFFKVTTFNIKWPKYIMEQLRAIVMTLTVVRIFLNRKKTAMVSILLIALSVFVFYETFFHIGSSYRNEMLNMLIIMIGCIDIPYRKIAKTYFITTFTAYIFTLINVLLGSIENLIYYRSVDEEIEKARYCLGMIHHAYPKIFLFYLVCAYLILRTYQITYVELVVIEIFNVLIYIFCSGRNHLICITLLLGGAAWFKIRKQMCEKKKKDYEPNLVFCIICCFSGILCAAFSFIMGFLYSPDNRIMITLNRLISGRLYFSKIAFDRIGLSLWGKDLSTHSKAIANSNVVRTNPLIIDNQYVRLVIHYGIFFFGIVMLLMYYMSYKAFIEMEWMMLLICAVNAFQFIIDRDMLMLNGNFLMLCVFASFHSSVALPARRRTRRVRQKEWEKG